MKKNILAFLAVAFTSSFALAQENAVASSPIEPVVITKQEKPEEAIDNAISSAKSKEVKNKASSAKNTHVKPAKKAKHQKKSKKHKAKKHSKKHSKKK